MTQLPCGYNVLATTPSAEIEVGLVVDSLEVGRMMRCKVEGDREKRGWYHLHEWRTDAGELLIVGSFGVWRGNDNGAQAPINRPAKAKLSRRTRIIVF